MKFFWDGWTKYDWDYFYLQVCMLLLVILITAIVTDHFSFKKGGESVLEHQRTILEACGHPAQIQKDNEVISINCQ